MWKLYNNIPCYNIRVGQVVELDITFYTNGIRECKSLKVVGLMTSAQNNCNYSKSMLLRCDDGSNYSTVWINGNMCRNCIYYKE